MNISVIGTGYVGLVVGACLAETGNSVTCADIDKEKIARLRRNDIPIYEPGLEPLVERNQKEQRLSFTTDLPEAIASADVIFIAVGTPPGEDGAADLKYVLQVAELIGRHMTKEMVVVTKSTVPVGSAAKVAKAVAREAKFQFHVCSNPEFLKEGDAVEDFMRPDRVVLGVESAHARRVMTEIYAPFVRTGKPVLLMDISSAEMTKYAANGMLATRISFMNEIANLCDKLGANVDFVRRGIGSDSRIGQSFLFPGPGYGGSCFPKDVQAFQIVAKQCNYDFGLLAEVMRINAEQRLRFLKKVKSALWTLRDKRLAVLGLSFKGDTDDVRESPAIAIIQALLREGVRVQVYDPAAMPRAKDMLPNKNVTYANDPYDAAANCDALLILTEWKEFANLNLRRIHSLLKHPIVIDGRNLYRTDCMTNAGLIYHSVGRPAGFPKAVSSIAPRSDPGLKVVLPADDFAELAQSQPIIV
ncbi:MAG TPA: UDP-glucose/GDP-mannose dehydrogenase family protein [Gemmatimonadaceae bacterium]|nr:UDP-glucose/GDP-mannose dehydrogenase family protein [Gemmatimonadaceae bacterium]